MSFDILTFHLSFFRKKSLIKIYNFTFEKICNIIKEEQMAWRKSKMEKIRKHIFFFGRVQGVGFRYRAYHAANYYGVSGWVKNLYDGSVEMEAEGKEEDIDKMIMSIEQGSFISIENIKAYSIPVCNDSGFRIR